mgnify:CR=1 FL=1
MKPITIPNISIPTIGIPTIGIPSVGFPSASGGGGLSWPAGMKEHIKAIYDPKKQGLTNYDVIESYADDFTKWRIENTGVTSTQKKIVIAAGTELKYNVAYKGFGNSIAKFDIKYTGNAVIRYQYNKEDGTTGIITINRSGIYHLPASIKAQKNFGFYCNPQTVTEEATIEQLPTSILKDFSGNGNHAYLYGGKGKLNSGMGVYQTDFTTWSKTNFDVHPEYIIATNGNNNLTLYGVKINSINVEIKGYNDKVKFLRLGYNNNDGIYKELNISNDGIYTIPGSSLGQEGRLCSISLSLKEDTKITITQIPDYPDQLCYDGKMYAVCYGFPILTDYTVMAERTWFEKEEYSAFISNSLGGLEDPSNGAFSVELKSLNSFTTISFGSTTSIGIPEKGITYQTKQSYNGNSINVGTKESNDILILGSRYFYKNNNTPGSTWTGCHGAIIIADRSFTEEEINWLKQNWDKI